MSDSSQTHPRDRVTLSDLTKGELCRIIEGLEDRDEYIKDCLRNIWDSWQFVEGDSPAVFRKWRP